MEGEGRGKEGEGPTFSLVYATPLTCTQHRDLMTEIRRVHSMTELPTHRQCRRPRPWGGGEGKRVALKMFSF